MDVDEIRRREREEWDRHTKRLEKEAKARLIQLEAEERAKRAAWNELIVACEGMDDVECWNRRLEHLERAEKARKAGMREEIFSVKWKEYGRVQDDERFAAGAATAVWEIRFKGKIVATPCYRGSEGWEVWWRPQGLKHGPFMAEARSSYKSPDAAVEAATSALRGRFPRATLVFRKPRWFSSIRCSRWLPAFMFCNL